MLRETFKADSDAREAATTLQTVKCLLQDLYHHHNSQRKEHTLPVSKEYNQELAVRLARVLEWEHKP